MRSGNHRRQESCPYCGHDLEGGEEKRKGIIRKLGELVDNLFYGRNELSELREWKGTLEERDKMLNEISKKYSMTAPEVVAMKPGPPFLDY